MKRVMYLLLIILLTNAAPDAEAARKRPEKALKNGLLVEMVKPRAVTATTGARVESKQPNGDPGDGKSRGKKPAKTGPPVEHKLRKAAGKVLDLRKLPQTPPVPRREKPRPPKQPVVPSPIMIEPGEASPVALQSDAFRTPIATAAAPAPIITFEGLDRENWGAGSPPDTTGDVGPDWYIQAVNTSVGIYRKSDGVADAAFTFDTLMSQGNFGNLCDTDNFGDPVVLYDTFEDRWVLTDFAFTTDVGGNVLAPAFQCFAVSMNGNPLTGGWNFYSIQIDDGLHDYEKLGVWTDGIYMSANMFSFGAGSSFQGARVWALNKSQMYAGNPDVQIVSFDVGPGDFTLIPGNARLQTGTPPEGTPNYFVSTWNYLNAVSVYRFKVDWERVALSTFTGPDVPIAGTSWPNATVANVPQPGTATLLDALQIRAMVQNQYTNIGGVESLWLPHTVRRANTTGFAAPRWYQVDVTAGVVAPNIPQAATWDPDGANVMHRWMPSLAIDRAGNMALAYSTSSASEFPSIRYAGRLATDPVNTFSQTEQTLLTGTASQTTSTRWGDYSSTMLDPDGCTFWVTNQYANPISQDFDKRWKTHIGAFRYPECTPVGAGGSISGTVTESPGGTPLSGAVVRMGTRSTSTDGSGNYSFADLPAGTYASMEASLAGYGSMSVSGVAVSDDATTTQDFSLTASALSDCEIDTSQADFQTGVMTDVTATVSPGEVQLARNIVVDQSNSTLGTQGAGFNTITWLGQTFTAALSGPVTRVDLNFFSLNCGAVTMPNLTVAIRNAASNLPTGADLATGTITGFCNGGGGWYTVNFATPFTVTAGTQYAIVWRAATALPAGTPAPGYFGTVSAGTGATALQNPYAGGRRTSSSNGGSTWAGAAGNANNDHGFVVYIDEGYPSSGTFLSSVKDGNPIAPLTPTWGNLTWSDTTPAGTSVRLQVAASNSATGPFSFVGPDGTAATWFTTSPAPLSQFYGFRYLRTRASLETTDPNATPALQDVSVCFENIDCTGPEPVITPSAASVCADTIGNTASGPAGMTSYAWSITNGSITNGATSQTVTYTAGASGTVQLSLVVTDAGGCMKNAMPVEVPITAVPATPSAMNGGPYCEDATIELSTPTVSGATYLWTGPNAFTSSEQNPTIPNATAAEAGSYSVTVSVDGCASAAGSTTVIINPLPAAPAVSNDGPYCETATIALSGPFVVGATYTWTGPDGFTSNVQNPMIPDATAAKAGTYSLTITVGGCTSAPGTTDVVVNVQPPSPTPTNTGPYCENATIALSTPTVSGATYTWTGPNGFTSTEQNPTIANATVAMTGTYSVTVGVAGCALLEGSTDVVVNAIPATPNASNGGPYCENATIALSTPLVAGATYAWSGPNGFTSTDQNPTIAGATPAMTGTYSVTITVDGCTSAAGSTDVLVNAIPATPVASNAGPYCENATIALSTPLVSGATYAWSGPNGFTTNDRTPTIANATLAMGGTYSVTVTVDGCTSAAGSTEVVVNAIPATPVASNAGPYCENATIGLSTPFVAGATYAWTGPDGFTSSEQNPAIAGATLAKAGSYAVTVTVNGCTSAAGSTDVVVKEVPATPAASNTGPYCENATIGLSTPFVADASYAWSGPNGYTSSEQNPTIANATLAMSGTYSVIVTVNGCSSQAGSTDVVVNAMPATPAASNAGPYCENATIALNTPFVSGATYAWTGPDGFTSTDQNPTIANATVAMSGTYSVTVTVAGCTSAAGSTAVVVNPAQATPAASNAGPYCDGATIGLSTPFVAGATYAWTGPNGFSSSDQNPAIANATAAMSGTYSVTVTVAGCTSPAGATDVVVNSPQAVPAASNSGPYCENETIALSTPFVAGATYAWSGPNGFTSTDQNPLIANATVAMSGTYSVTVTVAGCSSAAGSTVVVVNAIPATPVASNSGPYCENATIALSTPFVAGATYAWTGPNGFTSSGQNPVIPNATLAMAGSYSVTVTVAGCTSVAGSTTVVINPSPAMPAASNSGPYCENATIELSTTFVAGATYAWTGPNGFVSPDQNPTITNATAAMSGAYSVTVTVAGCTSLAGTTSVVVNSSQTAPAVANGGPYCEDATIALSTPFVAGATYAWSGPNGFTSSEQNPTIANATVAMSGSYSVTVTVAGCTSLPGTTNVVVNAVPAQPVIEAVTTSFCPGGSVVLTSSAGGSHQWYRNAVLIEGATLQTLSVASAGDYTVIVTENGCSSIASAATTVTAASAPDATIAAASTMLTGSSGSASVADAGAGATYEWLVTNGSITGGQGTPSLTFMAGAAGTLTIDVTITTAAACSDSGQASIAVTTAAPVVTITSVVPGRASTSGGTFVTLTGTGFQNGASVSIGGVAATSVVVVSATQITARTPAQAPGTVSVSVTNPDASSFTLAGALVIAQQFDPNGDHAIDPSDIFYLVNYLFTGGPAPQGDAGLFSGDSNGDGTVDPADVFYAVSHLFTGGPAPYAVSPRATVQNSAEPLAGALSLGTPYRRGNRQIVPVILSPANGSAVPQAISIKLRSTDGIAPFAIRRSGVSARTDVAFEISRRSSDSIAWLIVFDQKRGGLAAYGSLVIAEVEVPTGTESSLEFDRELTLFSDANGSRKATVANGSLELTGITPGRERRERPAPGRGGIR